MKIILAMIAGVALCASCGQGGPQFKVEGQIAEAADSMLYLEAQTMDGIKAVDSVKLGADGTFKLSAAAPSDSCPEFYGLRIGNQIISFSVDSTETITVKAASAAKMSSEYEISGNESSVKIGEIARLQQQVQSRIIAIEKNEDLLPGDMIDSVESIVNDYKQKVKLDYILPNAKGAEAYYAVCQSLTDLRGSWMLFNPLTDKADVRVYAAVATAWDAAYPHAQRTQQLCNMAIKGMENTAAPRQQVIEIDEDKVRETGIIDVQLPDINSNVRKLSDLKGKVVVMDFTMYGAPESAERTRIMRELYSKYHAQGLEIYQVSLDDDTHYWKYACEALPWICVHETDGHATNMYHVVNLPTFFLIDRNNEIVVRSELMEGSLEDNIKKLL